jgi:hypothetical protein
MNLGRMCIKHVKHLCIMFESWKNVHQACETFVYYVWILEECSVTHVIWMNTEYESWWIFYETFLWEFLISCILNLYEMHRKLLWILYGSSYFLWILCGSAVNLELNIANLIIFENYMNYVLLLAEKTCQMWVKVCLI